jgi:hypothetical protein
VSIRLTDGGIEIEDRGFDRPTLTRLFDPLPRHFYQRLQIPALGQEIRLESTHLARGSRGAQSRPVTGDMPHR